MARIRVRLLAQHGSWLDDAACAGTPLSWWYPRDYLPDDIPPSGSWARQVWYETAHTRAAAICSMCPVQPECLEQALAEEAAEPKLSWSTVRFGFRGGMTPRQREAYAAQMNLNSAVVVPAHPSHKSGVTVETAEHHTTSA